MIYLFVVLMFLIPYFLGKGFLNILYHAGRGQDLNRTDNLLTGWLVCIGLAEAAHLATVFTGKSFSGCVKLFCLALAAAVAISVAALVISRGWRKCNRPGPDKETAGKQIWRALLGIAVVVIISQVMLLLTEEQIYLKGDMTLETVNSFLTSDAIYQINPLTGNPYETGMPLRLKILCLPTLYAIFCSLFHLSARQVVWHIIPAFALVCSYLVYWQLSGIFFENSRTKRSGFLVLAALLLWVEDYLYGMDGFGALHSGFRGVSIRAMVLLPYTFSLILRKKWKLVILCILAEAAMVWTFYGMGACLFVAVGMYLAGRFSQGLHPMGCNPLMGKAGKKDRTLFPGGKSRHENIHDSRKEVPPCQN